MLPDFPEVKAHLRTQLLRLVERQVPIIAPILGQVSRFHQHEGKDAVLARADKSTAKMGYERKQFDFALTKDQMRVMDLQSLLGRMRQLAEHMASEQSTMLFARVSEAVEQVGNTVQTGGTLEKHHLLEMFEKVQLDFDPDTGEPSGQSFVMHPDTAAKVIPKIQEWEKDTEFVEAHRRILAKKREEWRDREDRRKLVD